MSTNFGTTTLPTVFKPAGATPIDVRTYFESYAAALAVAQVAAVAGDTNTIYYFGQLVTVFDPVAGTTTIYKIVKDTSGTTYTDAEGNEVVATGKLERIDEKFTVGDIPTASSTKLGAVMVPDSSDITIDSYTGAIDLDATTKATLAAVAGKQEALEFDGVYDAVNNKVATVATVTNAIGEVTHISYKTLAEGESLPEKGEAGVIYLVPEKDEYTGEDQYNEYIYVDGSYEKLGRSVDLAGAISSALASYSTTAEVEGMIDAAEEAIADVTDALAERATAAEEAIEAIEETLADPYTGVQKNITNLIAITGEHTAALGEHTTQIASLGTDTVNLGKDIEALEASVFDPYTGLVSTVSAIDARVTEAEGDIDTLEGKVSDLETVASDVLLKTSESAQTVTSDVTFAGIVTVEEVSIDTLSAESLEVSGAATFDSSLSAASITASSIKVGSDDVALAKDLTEHANAAAKALEDATKAISDREDAIEDAATKLAARVTEAEGDIDDLEVTVGDAYTGLVKAVADLVEADKTLTASITAATPIAEAGSGIAVTPSAAGTKIAVDTTAAGIVVTKAGEQTITGAKTFSASITLPENNTGANHAITRTEAVKIAKDEASAVALTSGDTSHVTVSEQKISLTNVAFTDAAEVSFAGDLKLTEGKKLYGVATSADTLADLDVTVEALNALPQAVADLGTNKQDNISAGTGIDASALTNDKVVKIDTTVVAQLGEAATFSSLKIGTEAVATESFVSGKIADTSATWDASNNAQVPTMAAIAKQMAVEHAGVMEYHGTIAVDQTSTTNSVLEAIVAKGLPLAKGDFFVVTASGDVSVAFGGEALTSNDLLIVNKAIAEGAELTSADIDHVDVNDATVVHKTGDETIEGTKTFAVKPVVPYTIGSGEEVQTGTSPVATIAELNNIVMGEIEGSILKGDGTTISTNLAAQTLTVVDYDKLAKADSTTSEAFVFTSKKLRVETPVADADTANKKYVDDTCAAVAPVQGDGIKVTGKEVAVDATVVRTNATETQAIAGTVQFTDTVQAKSAAGALSAVATIADVETKIAEGTASAKRFEKNLTVDDFAATGDYFEAVIQQPADFVITASSMVQVRDSAGVVVYPEILVEASKVTIKLSKYVEAADKALTVTII